MYLDCLYDTWVGLWKGGAKVSKHPVHVAHNTICNLITSNNIDYILKRYFILQAVQNNTIKQWSVDLLFVLFFFLYEMFNSMSTVHPSNNWPRSTHQHYTTCLNSVHSTIRKFDNKLCKCMTWPWRPHLFQYLLFFT